MKRSDYEKETEKSELIKATAGIVLISKEEVKRKKENQTD